MWLLKNQTFLSAYSFHFGYICFLFLFFSVSWCFITKLPVFKAKIICALSLMFDFGCRTKPFGNPSNSSALIIRFWSLFFESVAHFRFATNNSFACYFSTSAPHFISLSYSLSCFFHLLYIGRCSRPRQHTLFPFHKSLWRCRRSS